MTRGVLNRRSGKALSREGGYKPRVLLKGGGNCERWKGTDTRIRSAEPPSLPSLSGANPCGYSLTAQGGGLPEPLPTLPAEKGNQR